MNTAILEAFIDRLNSLSFSPALPIIYVDGVKKAPPATGMWLEFQAFPNEGNTIAWGAESPTNAKGFFQISVGYRPNIGIIQPSAVVDSIIAHFPYAHRFVGDVGVIKKPWRTTAVIESDKVYIPITIPFAGLV